jgi:hypothetical protein
MTDSNDRMAHGATEGVERRTFLKGAATVAWATPLILTMTSGRAGAASPACIPVNMACNACTGPQCCDVDGAPDGGCCCSPPDIDICDGFCRGTDASCEQGPIPNLPALNPVPFRCYAP